MAAVDACVPCCGTTLQTVNVPGSAGANAITTTGPNGSGFITLPAPGASVTINVGDTSWMANGKNVFISDGANKANFVVTVNSATQISGKFLALPGDTLTGNISDGGLVMAGMGNETVATDLDLLTAFVDNSGGVKSDTIVATVTKNIIVLGPFSMALLVNGQIWKVPVPYGYTVTAATFRCDVAITTGAKAATLTTQINGAATTGGVINVAGTYTSGTTQAGSAISAANTGTAGQTLEIAVSAVTAFSEGYGHVELAVTNTDLGAFFAAIAFKANQLRTALRHQ